MAAIISAIYLAITCGTTVLFGAVGETVTEKSGNLNLGIPGIMSFGAISAYFGVFAYDKIIAFLSELFGVKIPIIGFLAVIFALVFCVIGSAAISFIYAFLTTTLRANQNVTGLALTTFGVGASTFIGVSLNASLSARYAKFFNSACPFPRSFGDLLFSFEIWVFLAIGIAIASHLIFRKTKVGLKLRAVGESPATADAAGVNVGKYKYAATIIGGVIAGIGGLYYLLCTKDVLFESSSFNTDMAWLAIALVIFTLWKPTLAIPASYLFGLLLSIDAVVKLPTRYEPLLQMTPYVLTIVILIIVSIRNKKENQPPASLGTNYFREDR